MLVFSLMYLIPGDAAQVIAGEDASEQAVEQIRERLGLNDPVHKQYINYVSQVIEGDLGQSIRSGNPVILEIKDRFWVTLELAIYSTLLAVFIGIIAGVISAARHYSWLDIGIMVIALFGLSMPNFWLGLLLIEWFAVGVDWLPIPDFLMMRPSGWGDHWRQIILPVLTLGTGGAAIIARMTRSSMIDEINQDYIRTARAKGVKEKVIIFRHALKNALIPIVTVIGLEFGAFLGGAVVTETIFAINGLGRLTINAIMQRDLPIVQGSVLIISVLFVLVNLLVDISYYFINKRVELK